MFAAWACKLSMSKARAVLLLLASHNSSTARSTFLCCALPAAACRSLTEHDASLPVMLPHTYVSRDVIPKEYDIRNLNYQQLHTSHSPSMMHLCLPCATRYSPWLLIKLTPNAVVLSFLFLLLYLSVVLQAQRKAWSRALCLTHMSPGMPYQRSMTSAT